MKLIEYLHSRGEAKSLLGMKGASVEVRSPTNILFIPLTTYKYSGIVLVSGGGATSL